MITPTFKSSQHMLIRKRPCRHALSVTKNISFGQTFKICALYSIRVFDDVYCLYRKCKINSLFKFTWYKIAVFFRQEIWKQIQLSKAAKKSRWVNLSCDFWKNIFNIKNIYIPVIYFYSIENFRVWRQIR